MSSTEDENLADLKDWWTRNGKPLVTGGLLALVIVFGWQALSQVSEQPVARRLDALSAIAGNHADA